MNTTEPSQHDAASALAARLETLPREMQPGTDLWPGIRARIGTVAVYPDHPLRRFMPLALAASLAVALCSAVAGAWLGYGLGLQRAAVSPLAGNPEVERLELAFAGARESYLRGIAIGGERLDPSARETLRKNLGIIDQAVNDLHGAMAADPHNRLYVEALLMTREREMELLADFNDYTTTRL